MYVGPGWGWLVCVCVCGGGGKGEGALTRDVVLREKEKGYFAGLSQDGEEGRAMKDCLGDTGEKMGFKEEIE